MLVYLDCDATRIADTSTRGLTNIDGLFGVPGVRGDVFDRPEDDGAVEPYAQFYPARLVMLQGDVWGLTEAACLTEFAAIDSALSVGVRGYVTIRWQATTGGTQFQGTARLAGPVLPSLSGGDPGTRIAYQAQLRFPDPQWYDQTEQSSTAAAATTTGGIPFPIPFPIPFSQGSSGGTVVATNSGNGRAWPTITIQGPINGPVVGNVTAGEYLYFDRLNLSSGQTLLITTNPFGRAATVAGVSVQGALRWSQSAWPSISPGVAATFQFYSQGGGTGVGTALTVAWRNAYITPA